MKKVLPFFIVVSLIFVGWAFYTATQDQAPESTSEGAEEKEYLHSSMNNKQYYEDIYSALRERDGRGAQIGIVNHHLFAKEYIPEVLESIGTEEEKTVLLISPDHFSAGSEDFVAAGLDWDTAYGIMEADTELIESLGLTIDNEPFKEEHGITNIVTFIKHAFPNSKIVPLIVKELAEEGELGSIVNNLGDDVVVVGSFDFTHEEIVSVTQKKDKVSIGVLEELDVGSYKDVTVDSQKGVYLLMKYAEKIGATKFDLFQNSSAAELVGDYETTENASYITGIYY